MQRLGLFLCALSALGFVHSFSIATNEIRLSNKADRIIDALIDEVNNYLRAKGHTKVSIPDQSLGIKQSIIGIETDVLLNLTHGVFTNPATLHRAGPSDFNASLVSINFSIPASFSEMAVSYKFALDVLGIYDYGRILLDFERNEIDLRVFVKFFPHCSVKELEVRVNQLDVGRVKVDGFGFINSLVESITGAILPMFRASLSSTIEEAVKEKIRESIENKYCPMMIGLAR